MNVTVEFKHAEDHIHYALFTNSERMFEAIRDVDAVLAKLMDNNNTMEQKDLVRLHARISAILCEIDDSKSNKISQE